jgi:carbonic anhydrase
MLTLFVMSVSLFEDGNSVRAKANVERQAGGSAVEALRSIVVSQQFLGTTEVAIIKHTECGMMGFTQQKGRDEVDHNLG